MLYEYDAKYYPSWDKIPLLYWTCEIRNQNTMVYRPSETVLDFFITEEKKGR